MPCLFLIPDAGDNAAQAESGQPFKPERDINSMDVSEIRKKAGMMKKAGAHFSCLSAFSRKTRYGLVYHFIKNGVAVDVTVSFNRGDTVPDIADIYPSAAFYQVEAHETFGIKFSRLPREHLFLPDNWPRGKYPLRK